MYFITSLLCALYFFCSYEIPHITNIINPPEVDCLKRNELIRLQKTENHFYVEDIISNSENSIKNIGIFEEKYFKTICYVILENGTRINLRPNGTIFNFENLLVENELLVENVKIASEIINQIIEILKSLQQNVEVKLEGKKFIITFKGSNNKINFHDQRIQIHQQCILG